MADSTVDQLRALLAGRVGYDIPNVPALRQYGVLHEGFVATDLRTVAYLEKQLVDALPKLLAVVEAADTLNIAEEAVSLGYVSGLRKLREALASLDAGSE